LIRGLPLLQYPHPELVPNFFQMTFTNHRVQQFLHLIRLRSNRKLLRISRVLAAILTLASLVIVLRQATTELAALAWGNYVEAIVRIFLTYGVSFGLQVMAWAVLINGLSKMRFGWRDLEIYAYSNLMRRTPGMVWYLLERVERYRESGVSARFTLTASGLEWALLLVAALIIFFITNFPVPQIEILLIQLAVVLAVGVAGHILPARREWNPITTLVPATSLRERLRAFWPQMALSLFIYELCFFLGGLIVYELVRLIDPASSLTWLEGLHLWALTAGLAILGSIVIPLSLGLREITLVFVLVPFTSTVTAVTVAALLRTVFVVSDIGYSTLLWLFSKRVNSRISDQKSPHAS
jgi:hypothetical protein